MKRKISSLSTKIVLLIAAVAFLITFVIFVVSVKINKEAFYEIEIEKANLIARTIEPLIALNIYLEMQSNIAQITHQLIENPNILAVKVLKENKIIDEIKSKEYDENIDNSFVVKRSILEPTSKKEIASLVLVYSNKGHKDLVNKYKNLVVVLLFVLSILFILFASYVKYLLSPLKTIALSLKNYSPSQEIEIPFTSQNNEIGLISNALHNMQDKIRQYSKQQQNINKYLEEKVNEKTLELRRQLYIDTLTGLPNRFSLLNDVANITNGALLILNIDDFKEINDFYGHVAGDQILKDFSNKLTDMFCNDFNVAVNRLSGDEFTLLFMQKPSLENFTQIAKKVIFDIEKTLFLYKNSEVGIRVTIGGSYEIKRGLERADIALKSAKKQQKPFLLYDENLNIEEQYKNNMGWVKALKIAIKKSMIVPYFQPIFDNKSNKIISYECLVRLIDENSNVIGPYKFLTVAKKSKLYSKLTKIMVDKSCKFFEHLDYDFSINISIDDILNKDTVAFIKNKIVKYGVEKRVVFEILETEEIGNYKEISNFINEMKELGCKIAIDDFGSGYSNFEYLLQLNIDYIKIDGSLIKNIDKDIHAQIVVETVVSFAKKLHLIVVAEYVHNEEVYEKVKELNIDRSQGFFLCEPQAQI
ncbi:MAG: diguanylate cyclase [Sulfurimonas sp. RIFOXYD12_FULL_33_39]|uniref:bifunctional diguanylate cyclase/phosphodiesterase n=1 Tax=unclassified Sulfurimonas TaxID=2623549 RepID=UPI0008B4BE14|nr:MULTISPECIES: bifunctional diguanylate cyclase/phosphodiesterase [unclassified Sulfurimonas]OHE04765.1 MAG: diguanylate cyclase [Sulfurimonas sp. RIFCSPLOWO2_12_FULL_34_6]OHE10782.1 MAG: diguanylate cyclase [Sulfurimonas sp. RIFOXYD12_FULL_33_39]OHE13448.1 MAG: diguanylate cyclase [Sulfurimonas sp. RIFOXYD2_FULL_34_21]